MGQDVTTHALYGTIWRETSCIGEHVGCYVIRVDLLYIAGDVDVDIAKCGHGGQMTDGERGKEKRGRRFMYCAATQ
jgi:hypothetical protein